MRLTEISALHRNEDVKIFHVAFSRVKNPSTFEEMDPQERDRKRWLDSYEDVAPVVVGLLEDTLKRPDGAIIRVDDKNIDELKAELSKDLKE